jgi:hypothetical protein
MMEKQELLEKNIEKRTNVWYILGLWVIIDQLKVLI